MVYPPTVTVLPMLPAGCLLVYNNRNNRGFPKVRHHHSNACGRHFVWVQIHACTILDCTITTIMSTSLYVDGIPGAFPTKYMVYYCILALHMAGYSLQIVWLDRHITTSLVHG